MPHTIRTILPPAKQTLQQAGIASFSLDAELLLREVMGISRERMIGYPDDPVAEEQVQRFQAWLTRRQNREPISHLLGRREFWGRDFKVTKDTLDPRPDSETLIEAALAAFPDRQQSLHVIDLGVGTGCLLLTLLAELPNAQGLGVDISPEALAVAKENSDKLGLAKRAKFVIDRWGQHVDGTFDLVVSNPPYIKRSEIESLEPEVAVLSPCWLYQAVKMVWNVTAAWLQALIGYWLIMVLPL
jgi:release factor glutamine methyltransferase